MLALPLFHMHGLGVGLHGTLLCGASAVLLPRFDLDAVLDAARAEHATLFFGVPTMYDRLAALGRVCRSWPRCGSACRARRRCPPTCTGASRSRAASTVLERYGLTETLMNSSNPYDGERRAGTVGFPLPGVEIRLGDGDEILVRDPNVFAGYWEQPDATRASFDADGWFATGDIGAFDDDGYLSIVGRSKELIISGGFNVYPREVEDVLRAYPGVAEVAVIGTPSDEWGEVVTAVVVADGALDGDALLEFAAGSSRRSSDRATCASSTSCRATRSARSSATSSERQGRLLRSYGGRAQASATSSRTAARRSIDATASAWSDASWRTMTSV